MSTRKIEIVVGAQTGEAKQKIDSFTNHLESTAQKWVDSFRTGFAIKVVDTAVAQLQKIPAALQRAVETGVKFNATIERQTVAFSTLLKSVDAAAQRVAELNRFAADTPF